MTGAATSRRRPRVRVGGLLVVAALVLAAVNLRPALASVGPLLPTIRHDLGLSSAQAGLLTTIPTLCMALFAPAAAGLAWRHGAERVLVWALAAIGLATALRLAGGQVAILFGATLLLGVGIAVAQTLLPAVVKGRFPRRAVLVSGAYALAMNFGALLAASLTVPAWHALGSWEQSLALWGLLAPLAVLAWAALERRSTTRPRAVATADRLPWKSWTAWKLTLQMSGIATVFVVVLTWLAPLYQDHGYSEAKAGLVFTVFAAMQIVGGLLVPPLAYRLGRRARWLAACVAIMAAGLAGVAVAPESAPWLLASAIGFGMGGAFPLILVLFVDLAATPDESGRLTAMGFLVGYTLAAGGPAAAGGIRDLTGSLALPFAITAAISLLMAAGAPALRPPQDAAS